MQVPALSRLRERAGERVFPQSRFPVWREPHPRRFAPRPPPQAGEASGRGKASPWLDQTTMVVGVRSQASWVIATIDGTSMMPMLPQVNIA